MKSLRSTSSDLFAGSMFMSTQSMFNLFRLFLIFFLLEQKAKSIILKRLSLIDKS